jgi:LmbE family N-acetylglucosaminyl deacetylase
MKKLLALFAHPDDESFGPGGSIATWAQAGVEIEVMCATKGEEGTPDENQVTAQIRSKELEEAAKILGVKKVEFLGFKDGQIGNLAMIQLQEIFAKKIQEYQPDALLTFNLNGVSGHIDHIAVALAATKAFQDTKIPEKIYYYSNLKTFTDTMSDYFIYFPQGITDSQADEILDVTPVWDKRVQAMHCHKSQIHDITRILARYESMPKREYFLVKNKNNK